MSYRRLSSRLLVLSVGILLVSASWAEVLAQDRQGSGRGFGGRPGFGRGFGRGLNESTLIRSEQVQKELGITPQQKEKIDAATGSVQEGLSELRSSLRDLSGEERDQRMAELRSLQQELNLKATKQIEGVLNKEQAERLAQIMLQLRGARALIETDIVEKLKLSEDQGDQIRAVFKAQEEAQREMFQGASREDRRELFSRMREMRTKGESQAFAVLTEQQGSEFERLKGAAFEVDRASLFGGRGGFGGFGGGREADDVAVRESPEFARPWSPDLIFFFILLAMFESARFNAPSRRDLA